MATYSVGDESSKHSREADENSMWEEIRDLVLDEDEQDKAACTFLNEYFPALAYTLEKKDHEDGKFEYQATVDVEGKQFVSTGRSKRIAKSNVASVALKTLNEDGSLNDKRHEREEKRLRGGRTAGKGGGGRGNRGNSQRGFGMRSGFMQAPVPSLFGGTLGGQASFIRGGRGMRFRPRGTRGIRGSIRGAASSSDTFNNGFRGGSGRRGGQRGRGQAQDMDNNIKHGDSSYFTVNKPYNDDPTRPSANPSYPASNMNIQRNNDYSNMHKPSGYQQEVNRRNYNPTFNAGSQNMNMGGSNAPMGGNSGGNNPGSFSNQNPNYGGGFSQQQKPGMYGNQQQSFNNGGNNFNFNTRNQNMPFQANPNTGNQPPPPHFNPNVAPPPFNSGNPSFVNQTFGNNSNHGNNPNLGSNPNHGNNPNQGNNPNLGSNPSHGNNRNLGNNTNYGNNPNLGNNPNPNFGNSTGNDQGMASGFNNSANNGFSSGPTNMGTQGSMGNAMNTNMGRSDGWNNSQHNNPEMYQQSPAMAGNFAAHGPPMYSGGAPQHGQHNMSGYDMNMQAQGNNHY